jgi:hypothetical protein
MLASSARGHVAVEGSDHDVGVVLKDRKRVGVVSVRDSADLSRFLYYRCLAMLS